MTLCVRQICQASQPARYLIEPKDIYHTNISKARQHELYLTAPLLQLWFQSDLFYFGAKGFPRSFFLSSSSVAQTGIILLELPFPEQPLRQRRGFEKKRALLSLSLLWQLLGSSNKEEKGEKKRERKKGRKGSFDKQAGRQDHPCASYASGMYRGV